MTVRRLLRRDERPKVAALRRNPSHPRLHRRQLGAHPRDRPVDTAAVGAERRAAVAEGGHFRVDAAERRHRVADGGGDAAATPAASATPKRAAMRPREESKGGREGGTLRRARHRQRVTPRLG